MKKRLPCMDCGADTIRRMYMVREELWYLATTRDDYLGHLCIECLEARLGCVLGWYDFITCPLNDVKSQVMWERYAIESVLFERQVRPNISMCPYEYTAEEYLQLKKQLIH